MKSSYLNPLLTDKAVRGGVSEGLFLFSEGNAFSLICYLVVSAAVRNHWPESSTEPQVENIPFGQHQGDFSAVAPKGRVMVQIADKSHTALDAAENFTPQTGTAGAGERNNSLRVNVTTFPVGSEIATALTSQSSTVGELVLMTLIPFMCVQCWTTQLLPVSLPLRSLSTILGSWAGDQSLCS